MSATRTGHRPTPAETTTSDFAPWGPVHLDVTDGERSLAFWRDLVGLQLLEQRGRELRLGVEGAELVVLHPGALGPVPRGHAGLYHLAIHLPSEAEFARVLGRLFSARYPNSPTDHIMHWATYLDDPDGIGLELSFETFDRFARYDLEGARPLIVDSEGRRRDPVAPLDLDEVFSHLSENDFSRSLPPATRIGHLHLHVSNLEEAVRFYEAVGFTRGVILLQGMAELNAGGSFPHRLALNVWQGVGAPPRPQGMPGLRQADLCLRSMDDLQAATERVRSLGAAVEEHHGGAAVTDPAGNRVYLAVPHTS
jgi:catechol 2,3-dioxygenase